MQTRSIHKAAEELIWFEQDKEFPINPISVARKQGLQCVPFDLNDAAVALYIEAGKGHIGYNPNIKRISYRFAIAHALGHFTLHKHVYELFVDVHFRMQHVKPKDRENTAYLENEANQFALALLMPETLLVKEIEKMQFDLSNDEQLKDLAKKFDVTCSALFFRLSGLNIL